MEQQHTEQSFDFSLSTPYVVVDNSVAFGIINETASVTLDSFTARLITYYDDTLNNWSYLAPIIDVYEWDQRKSEIWLGVPIMRDGRVIKYVIDYEVLWVFFLVILHYRLMRGGDVCLINLRSISKQIKREGNIKSIVAIEKTLIDLVKWRFGVDVKDKKPYGMERTIDELVGTMEFWNSVGGRKSLDGSEKRRSTAIVLQVSEGLSLIDYIKKNYAEAIEHDKERRERRRGSSSKKSTSSCSDAGVCT
ncbi:MAG: hypothetical protein P1Q69_07340 [Candidatus Thorarchaeota archaeon]|nr:hypothetical protein [Candidatus Thorarchaeota archaeon]